MKHYHFSINIHRIALPGNVNNFGQAAGVDVHKLMFYIEGYKMVVHYIRND